MLVCQADLAWMFPNWRGKGGVKTWGESGFGTPYHPVPVPVPNQISRSVHRFYALSQLLYLLLLLLLLLRLSPVFLLCLPSR